MPTFQRTGELIGFEEQIQQTLNHFYKPNNKTRPNTNPNPNTKAIAIDRGTLIYPRSLMINIEKHSILLQTQRLPLCKTVH